MKSTAFCPISERKIDENVARLNGAFTIVSLALSVFLGTVIPILVVLVDFALRSGRFSRYSAFSFLSRFMLKSLALKPIMINAGPKVFAARIGLVFSFSILLSFLVGFSNAAYVLSGVFGVFAFLESALGICVACQIYPFVYKLRYVNNTPEN